MSDLRERFIAVITDRLIDLVETMKTRGRYEMRNNQMVLSLIKENYSYLVILEEKETADKIISELGDKIRAVLV